MLSKQPTILVYNPISGHGHLDSWNAMFIALLLERGWRVLALTPDINALMTRLDQKGLAISSSLKVLDWNAHQSRIRRYLRTIWKRWESFGDMYFYRRAGSEANPDLSFGEYWKRRLYQVTVPFLFRASYFIYSRLQRVRTTVGHTPSPQNAVADPENHLACPVDMARRANAAVKKGRIKPALALNMYMDTYRTHPLQWDAFAAANKLSWAGVRFVPPEQPYEAWYKDPLWRGMGLLDESMCQTYSTLLPTKHFAYLPDITETALPEGPSAIVQAAQQRAAGRKIVFLGGSIGGQKNLAQWFELIKLADPTQWFFVQIGEIHRNTLTTEDVTALDEVLAVQPENLMLHTQYLPDERIFNEIINASDVIFAVYRNFRISSNMVGKAACFRKPILVSNRYLLGQRVTQYGIGRAVDEDNASAMISALAEVEATPVPEACFTRYCSDFSLTKLAMRLEGFLYDCME